MKQIGISEELEHKVKNMLFLTILGNICDSIFYAVDKETDPDLEAYIPFRKFSKYLMKIGFGGVAFRSTRFVIVVSIYFHTPWYYFRICRIK